MGKLRATWSLVAVLGVGAALAFGAQNVKQHRVATHTTPLASAVQPRQTPWQVGATRSFDAELDSLITVRSQPLVGVRLAGNWKLTRVSAGADAVARIVARLEVRQLELETSPESEDPVRLALGESVVFDISARGLIVGIGFERGEQPDAAFALSRGLLRALAASMQVAQPADAAQKSWGAREVDFTGTYEALYERQAPRSLVKTKQSYTNCASCQTAQSETRIVRSRIELAFADDAATPLTVNRVSSNEATRVEGGTPLPELSSETKLRLHLSGTETSSPEALQAAVALASNLKLLALDNRGLDRRAVLGEAKIAGTTFGGLSDEIARLDGAGQRSSGQRARAFAQLSAHLRYDAGAAAEALRRIRAGDGIKDTLIDALGSAGSESAQDALRQLLRSRETLPYDRQGAVLALSFTPKPSTATTDLLAQLQDDPSLGRQSRYGLGVAAYKLNGEEPGRASALVAALEARLQTSASLTDTMEYLRALGNAANPASVTVIVPYLRHQNSSVRAMAVNALRRIPGTSVDLHLATAFADSSAEVRLSVASSLDYRESSATLVQSLVGELTEESDRNVRLQATRVAVKWATRESGLRPVLSRLAQSDPDQKIREVAATASQS